MNIWSVAKLIVIVVGVYSLTNVILSIIIELTHRNSIDEDKILFDKYRSYRSKIK